MTITGVDKARESREKISPEAETYEDVKRILHSTIWKFRAKYGARDVEAYYPRQDVAVEVRLA